MERAHGVVVGERARTPEGLFERLRSLPVRGVRLRRAAQDARTATREGQLRASVMRVRVSTLAPLRASGRIVWHVYDLYGLMHAVFPVIPTRGPRSGAQGSAWAALQTHACTEVATIPDFARKGGLRTHHFRYVPCGTFQPVLHCASHERHSQFSLFIAVTATES